MNEQENDELYTDVSEGGDIRSSLQAHYANEDRWEDFDKRLLQVVACNVELELVLPCDGTEVGEHNSGTVLEFLADVKNVNRVV